MLIQICVGSSCCLKGSYEIVELAKKYVEENNLDTEIALCGGFCVGKCNRIGVTITIDDQIYSGISKENFPTFFKEHVLDVVKGA